MDIETKTHTLPDGRTLAYCEYGDPDGDPVFHAHGVLSSRLEGAVFHDKAARHGFRFICTDRPGMGRSTYLPDRCFLDYPKDIASLADALGLERFGVTGISGGGAHAVVCSYALPERLTFNMAMCPFVNFAEFPSPEALLPKMELNSWRWAQRSPKFIFALCAMMSWAVRLNSSALSISPEKIQGPDGEMARAHPDEMAKLAPTSAESVVQGGKGIAVDTLIQYSDWGFRVSEIPGKVHIFHGTKDPMVPFEFGRYLAENIPGGELHALEGRGHFLMLGADAELVFESARKELRSQPI